MKRSFGWTLALVTMLGGGCDGDDGAAGGTAGVGAGDVGAGDDGTGDVGGADVGTGDVGGDDVGSDDGGAADVGGDDVGGGDVGTGDVGAADVGTGDVGGEDVGAGDVGAGDVGAADVGDEDVGAQDELYVVVVRGRLAEADPGLAQQAHDAVALGGKDAALALGDIAHTPFVSMADPQEFLAVDVWTSFEGLQTFLGDPNVQAAFGSLFEAPPAAAVWIPQAGWAAWGDLTDLGADDQRWLVTVEATLKGADAAEAGAAHDAVALGGKDAATAAGDVAHLPHLSIDGSLSFLAMDIWVNAEGMQAFLGNPDVQAAFGSIFTGPPQVGVWAATGWASW